MLELGSSGSARGVRSNVHPYRDPRWNAVVNGYRGATKRFPFLLDPDRFSALA